MLDELQKIMKKGQGLSDSMWLVGSVVLYLGKRLKMCCKRKVKGLQLCLCQSWSIFEVQPPLLYPNPKRRGIKLFTCRKQSGFLLDHSFGARHLCLISSITVSGAKRFWGKIAQSSFRPTNNIILAFVTSTNIGLKLRLSPPYSSNFIQVPVFFF